MGDVNTFENKKFVDKPQKCFAFTPQANFPAHNSNFRSGEGDGIESRLPFKIFPTFHGTHMEVLAVKKNQSNFVIKCGTKGIFQDF